MNTSAATEGPKRRSTQSIDFTTCASLAFHAGDTNFLNEVSPSLSISRSLCITLKSAGRRDLLLPHRLCTTTLLTVGGKPSLAEGSTLLVTVDRKTLPHPLQELHRCYRWTGNHDSLREFDTKGETAPGAKKLGARKQREGRSSREKCKQTQGQQ